MQCESMLTTLIQNGYWTCYKCILFFITSDRVLRKKSGTEERFSANQCHNAPMPTYCNCTLAMKAYCFKVLYLLINDLLLPHCSAWGLFICIGSLVATKENQGSEKRSLKYHSETMAVASSSANG